MTDCSTYENVSKSDFIVAWVLVVGIYISFVPQHVKVIRRRTSEGLSPAYLFMGSISAYASAVNMYLVSVPGRKCCSSTLNAYQCANAMTGYIQVAVQGLGYCLIIILCVFLTKNSVDQDPHDYKLIYRYFLVFMVYVVANFVICLCVVHTNSPPRSVPVYADVSGIISAILQVTQYFPQLWTTFKLRRAGSLSIPSLVIQVPGTYYWAYSLYQDPGSRWSSYVPFFLAASLQGILLLMCIYYLIRDFVKRRLERAASQNLQQENTGNSESSNEDVTVINNAAIRDEESSTENSIPMTLATAIATGASRSVHGVNDLESPPHSLYTTGRQSVHSRD